VLILKVNVKNNTIIKILHLIIYSIFKKCKIKDLVM
jgi:hypothetical protein